MDKSIIRYPIKLSFASAWRTYLGGMLIRGLHGEENPEDNHFPEEWIMSVVSARNAGREHIKDEGMSYIVGEDKLTLKELVKAYPEEILGKSHYEKYNLSMGVLIKLIDSSERLSIQVHPDKNKARMYFNSDYGKTECWHILGGREINGEKPCIYMGFKDGITKEKWKEVFDKQDIDGMLDCLYKFEVNVGDTFLIKGGMPHAIGAGCFLTEIQEPTDYTLRTERSTPSGLQIDDFMVHQGIGFEKMLDCFNYDGMTDDVAKKLRMKPEIIKKAPDYTEYKIISYEDTPCFKMHKVTVSGEYTIRNDGVYKGVYVLDGKGEFVCKDKKFDIDKAEQYMLSSVCGDVTVKNTSDKDIVLLIANGPMI